MKIEALEWLQVGRWFYLLVHTEEGITGLGEGGVHGYPEAIGGILESWRPYLLGQDPLKSSTTGSSSTATPTSGGR